MDRYAVFGHPIGHSRSPEIHARFAEQTGHGIDYRAIEVPLETFEARLQAFRQAGGQGINCTLPLKERAFACCTSHSPRALHSGAVNTLLWLGDGSLHGDNTDGIGLVRDLTQNLGVRLQGMRILILGAGGATRGIIAPLFEAGASSLWIANRTPPRAQTLAAAFREHGPIHTSGFGEIAGDRPFDLVLNATAASLSDDGIPLPEGLLDSTSCCYDLAYAKEATPFLRWGKRHGARLNADGIGMLVEQAAEAFFLWRGVFPETAPVIEALCQGGRILL